MRQKGKMMTEENATTKPGPAKRFFRWVFTIARLLFIVLLALLLIGGLYFQAPWKVLILIAIILATLTIIPKRARKWIWLTFGVIVVALIVWVFLPEEGGDWRPYTFDEELAAMEAKRAIPDDQNAATIYNKLIEIYDANDLGPEFFRDRELYAAITNEFWSSEDYPEIAEWIRSHQDTIETLMEACERDGCRFPLRPDMIGLEDSMDKLNPMRDWARLLVRSGSNNIGDGNIDEGLAKYLSVLQMAKHLFQQPDDSGLLFGSAFERMTYSQITRFVVLSDATEKRLGLMNGSLDEIEHDWAADWKRIVEYNTLFAKNFWGTFYQVNAKGQTRFIRGEAFGMRDIFPEEEIPKLTYWQKKLDKAGCVLGWFVMPSTPQEAAKVVDKVYERFYTMSEPDFDWQKEPEGFSSRSIKLNFKCLVEMLASMEEETHHMFHDLYLRNISDNRAAQLVIALRRYKNECGHWPGSLEDVKPLAPVEIFVDPVNNDSFVYRLTEDGFTLYSKGKNGIDEAGDRRTKKPDGTETDDHLIWPPESRKTEK
jgi:hypothetical protein